MPISHLSKLVEGIERSFEIEYQYITSQFGYGLEKGISREEIIAKFLRKYLPRKLYFGPGIVISSDGRMSLPQDIVIFDHMNYSMFPISESSRMFPCEGVLGLIQVKSKIDEEELKSAVANLGSAKQLATKAGGHPISVIVGYSS